MSFFNRKKYPEGASDRDNDPSVMNDVYAGPEEPSENTKRKLPFGRVYAGPGNNSIMKTVYAGPPLPDRESPPMEGVYAGPAPSPAPYDRPGDQQQRTMMVYAGPAFWNPQAPNGPMGMAAGNLKKAEDTNPAAPAPVASRFCPTCGAKRSEGMKFCSECGVPFPDAPAPSEDPEASV